MKAKYLCNMLTMLPLVLFLALCSAEGSTTSEEPERRIAWGLVSLIPRFLFKASSIFTGIGDIWEYLMKKPNSNDSAKNKKNIYHEFAEISSKLKNIENEVIVLGESVQNLLQTFPKVIKLELNLHQLVSIKNQINFAEEQMQKYITMGYQNQTKEENPFGNESETSLEAFENDSDKILVSEALENEFDVNMRAWEPSSRRVIEKLTMLNFALWATGPGYNSLQSLIRRMNDIVAPEVLQSLFDMINELSKEKKSNMCSLKESTNQALYNLYSAIAVTELKGYVLLQFSYILLKMYKRGNFRDEARIAQANYEKYTRQKLEAIRKALSEADRSIYKCDPKQYVEGVTHTRVTNFLQGYVENEINLNSRQTCTKTCSHYSSTKYYGCYKNEFCARQPHCTGNVINCVFVDSDMKICKSTNPDRRYEWIEYKSGTILGRKAWCPSEDHHTVDSWWWFLFWHCSYCLCFCEENSYKTHRYFNLREVTSDIEENKIVTGVRFIKQNKIIHLQIQQGVLTAVGHVDKTTLAWKPVDNYTINDKAVKSGVDYHALTWHDRGIDTDEVYGPSEHVVTGLRLRKFGNHMNLGVRLTPINFFTGEVFGAEESYWLSSYNKTGSKTKRPQIILSDPDIPTRKGPHSLASNINQYIKFQPTSFARDAGQSTVPFLDSQPLTSQGFPISGLGLIHRGKSGSGGFLAPKLISYDFAAHLTVGK